MSRFTNRLRGNQQKVLGLLLLAVFNPGRAPARQDHLPAPNEGGEYALSVQVGLVVLRVSVTDSQGHVVANLDRENFRVLDNHQPQKITVFDREDIPVTVGLVVDESGSMAPNLPSVNAAALAFASSSNPQDQMFVVCFNDTVFLGLPGGAPFTRDAHELIRSLSSFAPRGKTALFDAIAAALGHFHRSPTNRNVLIVLSDGGDNASKHKFRQVLEMAERSNVTIYTIALLDQSQAEQNPGQLGRFAKVTGGRAYRPQNAKETVSITRQIAGDIRHQYTLGFVPPNAPRSRAYHKLQVHVETPNHERLRVRTRAGYRVEPKPPEQALPIAGQSSSRGRGAR